MTDYKATAKRWAEVEEWVEGSECSWDHCLIELRDRVETLECSLQQTRIDYLRLSNAVAKICPDRNKFFADLIPDKDDHIGEVSKKVSDSLVGRVTAAIEKEQGPYRFEWGLEAKAAIREVAAWLRDQTSIAEALIPVAKRLEREVEK
jgi:hypothetical protein